MKRFQRYGSLTLLTVALCSVSSFAQGFSFTIFGGYNNPGNLSFSNIQSELSGTGIFGLRFETDFFPLLGLEHTVAVIPNFGVSTDFDSSDKSPGIIYNSNLVLNMPLGRLVPYLTAGIGLVHSSRSYIVQNSGNAPSIIQDFGTHFAVNYGGGFKMPRLAGPIGLRFDVREYNMPEGFSDTFNQFEVSGGVMFSF